MKKIQVNKRIVKNPTSVVPQLQVAVVTNFKVTYSSLLLCILVYILICTFNLLNNFKQDEDHIAYLFFTSPHNLTSPSSFFLWLKMLCTLFLMAGQNAFTQITCNRFS